MAQSRLERKPPATALLMIRFHVLMGRRMI
jgi:hypothetical protein